MNSENPIYKLIIQGTTLVSIEVDAEDGNYICKVWDLKSKEVRNTLRNIAKPDSRPRVAIIDNVLFVVGTAEAEEIKAWNIKTGKQFPSLLITNMHDHLRDIQSHEGKLYFNQYGQFIVYDFNLAPLSRQVLEENLSIIEKMAALENGSAKFIELANTLHPSFQKRLLSAPKKTLLCTQTELIVELLLGCIRSGDQKRISDLLMKLVLLNSHKELCECLWVVCGKPELPEKSDGRPAKEIWAELAFGTATVEQKEQALLKFKSRLLKEEY